MVFIPPGEMPSDPNLLPRARSRLRGNTSKEQPRYNHDTVWWKPTPTWGFFYSYFGFYLEGTFYSGRFTHRMGGFYTGGGSTRKRGDDGEQVRKEGLERLRSGVSQRDIRSMVGFFRFVMGYHPIGGHTQKEKSAQNVTLPPPAPPISSGVGNQEKQRRRRCKRKIRNCLSQPSFLSNPHL